MKLTLALVAAALLLGGCETTADESARLQKRAKHADFSDAQGLSITKPSREVKVLSAQILTGHETSAAVITLREDSSKSLRDVPLSITARAANGKVLFQNNAPGLERALVSVALLRPGQQTIWVDDQLQTAGVPRSLSALAGEARAAPSSVPQLQISAIEPMPGSSSTPAASGTVHNGSTVAQQNLVIYAVAKRAGKIVGAGRAIVPELAAHGSSKFEVFFVGSISAAHLQMTAPPTSF